MDMDHHLSLCAVSLLLTFCDFPALFYTGLQLVGSEGVATGHPKLCYLLSCSPWVLFCAPRGKP